MSGAADDILPPAPLLPPTFPGGISFDATQWAANYPMFTLTPTQLAFCWRLAQRYVDNTPNSPITDNTAGGERETDLWLVVAHIAQITYGTTGQAPSSTVGRVQGATTGSVSVQLNYPEPNSAIEGFFQQTVWGNMFWTLTEQYRLGGLYIGAPVIFDGPFEGYNYGQIGVTYPFLPGAFTPIS